MKPSLSTPAAVAVSVAVFAFATAFGLYAELPYYLAGETAEGAVTAVEKVTTRTRTGTGRRSKIEYVTRYRFREAGGAEREGSVRRSTASAVGEAVSVEYVPGPSGRSRLGRSRRGDPTSMLVFPAAAAGLALWWGWRIVRARRGGRGGPESEAAEAGAAG